MQRSKKLKIFRRYKNLSGASTVARYEIEKDGMTIIFTDGSTYRYTNQSAEPGNISKMKTLALAGKGLGTFVKANLKDRFLRKVR